MNQTIQPLKDHWKIDEEKGYVPDQIQERVDSEDWYTYCKGYPLTSVADKGRTFMKSKMI